MHHLQNLTNDNIYLSRTFSAERTDRCDGEGRLISTSWRCRQRLRGGDEAIMALSAASPAVQEGTCGFWRRGGAAIIAVCFQLLSGFGPGRCRWRGRPWPWVPCLGGGCAVRTSGLRMTGDEEDDGRRVVYWLGCAAPTVRGRRVLVLQATVVLGRKVVVRLGLKQSSSSFITDVFFFEGSLAMNFLKRAGEAVQVFTGRTAGSPVRCLIFFIIYHK